MVRTDILFRPTTSRSLLSILSKLWVGWEENCGSICNLLWGPRLSFRYQDTLAPK